MGNKRKHDSRDDKLLNKIRKLEKKLRKRRHRYSSSSESLSDHKTVDEDDQFTCIISDTEPEVQVSQPPPLVEGGDIINSEEVEIVHLDEDILNILGDAPIDNSPVGKDTHIDIASRLSYILQNGLKKDLKEQITKEYPVPGNCKLFKAPILNAEIKAAISEVLHKKDTSLAARQDQIGTALSALTNAMDILISEKSENNQLVLKHVNNACRLISDSHFIDTKMRRNFLISTLNNKLKDTLKDSKRDTNLFGENLPEKLKASKAITKSSQDLRPFKPRPNISKNAPSTSSTVPSNLNWKRPQPNAPTAYQKAPAMTHRTAGSSSTSHRTEATTRHSISARAMRGTAKYRGQKR